MTVGDYLEKRNQNVITCRPEDTVQAAATLMSSNRIGAMPVRDTEGQVVGMISERDIVRAFSTHSARLVDLLVADLMTKKVITCTSKTTIREAMETMSSSRIRHLPVFHNEEFVGVISIGDTLATMLEAKKMEADVLRDIAIARAG